LGKLCDCRRSSGHRAESRIVNSRSSGASYASPAECWSVFCSVAVRSSASRDSGDYATDCAATARSAPGSGLHVVTVEGGPASQLELDAAVRHRLGDDLYERCRCRRPRALAGCRLGARARDRVARPSSQASKVLLRSMPRTLAPSARYAAGRACAAPTALVSYASPGTSCARFIALRRSRLHTRVTERILCSDRRSHGLDVVSATPAQATRTYSFQRNTISR